MNRNVLIFSLFFLISIGFSTAFLSDTAIYHWGLNETSGTNVYDSINSNNGTSYGTLYQQSDGCLIDNCLNFSGSDSSNYVVFDANSITGQNFTINLWSKKESNPAVYRYLFYKQDAFGIGTESITPPYYYNNDRWNGVLIGDSYSFFTDLVSNTSQNIDEWYMNTLTYDGTTATLYYNGVIVSQESCSGDIAINSYPLYLGRRYDAGVDLGFDGLVDEITIFNSSKSADEVMDIYLNESNGIGFPYNGNFTYPIINTSITVCQVLDTPNIYFRLNNSVYKHGGSCFNITANNVTVDCDGYNVVGLSITDYQNAGFRGVMNDTRIFNCNISGFGYGISIYNFTDPAQSVYNIHIENVTSITHIAGSTSIELRFVKNLLMRNVYSNDYYDDSIFIVGDTDNLTFDNVTSIGGEYGISFYGNIGASPRTVHSNTVINNSYVSAGNSYVGSAGIGFVGIHDNSDNYNTQIINTIINNTGLTKPCLRTTSGSANTIVLNTTFIGNYWIDNPETDTIFNNSFIGNNYYLNNGSIASTIFDWIDTNGNFYADTGSDIPVSSATVGSYWVSNGGDYHPFTLTQSNMSCIPNWTQNNISCNGLIQNYTIIYSDLNVCNSSLNLPVNNGSIVSCCIESWVQFNSSCNGFNYTVLYNDSGSCNTTFTLPISNGTVVNCSSCIESWVQNNSACNGASFIVGYSDVNLCGTVVNLSSDNGTALPCSISYEGRSSGNTGGNSVLIAVPQSVFSNASSVSSNIISEEFVLVRWWHSFIAWIKGWWYS